MTEKKKMITELTPEQTAGLDVVRDEWLAYGLSTERADRAEAERGVVEAYQAAGLEPPALKVWLDSPMAGAIGAWLLTVVGSEKVGRELEGLVDLTPAPSAYIRESIGWLVDKHVDPSVRMDLWGALLARLPWAEVIDQISRGLDSGAFQPVPDETMRAFTAASGAEMWTHVLSRVSARIWDQVWREVVPQMSDLLDQVELEFERASSPRDAIFRVTAKATGEQADQVRDALRRMSNSDGPVWPALWVAHLETITSVIFDAVQARIREDSREVWSDVRGQMYRCGYGQHDASWLSFYDFFGRYCGLEEEVSRLAGVTRIGRSAGWWWPFSGAVILTERASELHRDPMGRLHNETGPALLYPDGWGVWAWHGVRVDPWVIDGSATVEKILTEPNTEVRRCAIEAYGWPRFIEDAKLKQLAEPVSDPGNPGQSLTLYSVPQQIYEEAVNVLIVTNGTEERDGTRRSFGLTVPADVTDPVAAAAWGYGLRPEDYAQLNRRS